MSLLLTQQEADALLSLEKHYIGSDRFSLPSLGGTLRIPLHSSDHREEFSLDITRGRIKLCKNTFQARARKVVILARSSGQKSQRFHQNTDTTITTAINGITISILR